MGQQANKFWVLAAATAVVAAGLIGSTSAQNSEGAGMSAQSFEYGNPSGEMPNSLVLGASVAHAKAEAAMATEPAVLPAPSQSGGIGGAASAQMGTYSGASGEMPNSLVPGASVAHAKAEAAMATVPDSAPMPFPAGKPRP